MEGYQGIEVLSHEQIPVTLCLLTKNTNLSVISFSTESSSKNLGESQIAVNPVQSQSLKKEQVNSSEVVETLKKNASNYDIRVEFDRQPNKYFTANLPNIQRNSLCFFNNIMNPQNQKLHLLLEMSDRQGMLTVTNVYREGKMVIKNGRNDRKSQNEERPKKKRKTITKP